MTKVRYDVDQLDEALAQLVDAGELGAEQAQVVHDKLASVEVAEPAALSRGFSAAPLVAAYVGVGLVLAAVATLLGQNWQHLSVLARTGAFFVITAVLVMAGSVLRERYDSARGLAWLAAVIAAGGTGGALFSGDSVDGRTAFFVATVTALVVSVVLLRLRPEPAQVLGFAGAGFAVVLAGAARFEIGPGVGGTVLWALGMGFGFAALRGWLPAQQFALALGGLGALVGTHFAGADSLLLCTALALVLATCGYVAALGPSPAVPLTVATLTVATAGPRILGQWLHGSLGAAGVLALSGLIILGAAAAQVRLTKNRSPT